MGKNKVGLTWPMIMQCTSCAKATLRHLAARPGWHRGYWAIRACAKKQDSRSYLSLTTRSSWDMATYTALFLSIMDGARKLLRSCWQHHLRAVPGRNRETLWGVQFVAWGVWQHLDFGRLLVRSGKLAAPHLEAHQGQAEAAERHWLQIFSLSFAMVKFIRHVAIQKVQSLIFFFFFLQGPKAAAKNLSSL